MDLGAVDAHVRSGFVQKVFSLVAAQLLLTAAVCAAFMFVPSLREFVLAAPSMQMISFFASLGLLMACFAFKDQHPNNLYCLFAFTLSIAWSVGTVCARYYAVGLGLVVLQAVALTASATVGLTLYTLRSKKDFSYMGAGLGASLWVLIIGSLVCSLVGMPAMHLALSVGGAAIFSLYIVYDVHMIPSGSAPTNTCSARSRSTSTSSTSSSTSCASSPSCSATTEGEKVEATAIAGSTARSGAARGAMEVGLGARGVAVQS